MSHGVVLFTASTRSRREIEDLAAEARRLRPDVEIVIRPPAEPAYRYKPAFPRCSADPPTENDVGSVGVVARQRGAFAGPRCRFWVDRVSVTTGLKAVAQFPMMR